MLLRSVLRSKPELRRCRARCRHCGIFFLADPRAAWREDLGCPFGCREAHRKRQSTRRSVAYYQSQEGKSKKRDQNNKRRKAPVASQPPKEEGLPWPRPIVEYVRVVVSLIEGRKISFQEIVEMLQQNLRQHSMCRRRKIDQSVVWLNEQPP